jgi:hypothetical protein
MGQPTGGCCRLVLEKVALSKGALVAWGKAKFPLANTFKDPNGPEIFCLKVGTQNKNLGQEYKELIEQKLALATLLC